MLILSASVSQPVVTVVQVTATLSRTDSTHTRDSRSTLFVSCPKKKRHTSSRNVIRYTLLEHYTNTGHVHSSLIFDTIFLTSTFQPASTVQICDLIRVALWLNPSITRRAAMLACPN